MEEIKERSLLYEKLMHYFIINFPQRPGALKEFVAEILGPGDDIVHFEYKKKNILFPICFLQFLTEIFSWVIFPDFYFKPALIS